MVKAGLAPPAGTIGFKCRNVSKYIDGERSRGEDCVQIKSRRRVHRLIDFAGCLDLLDQIVRAPDLKALDLRSFAMLVMVLGLMLLSSPLKRRRSSLRPR